MNGKRPMPSGREPLPLPLPLPLYEAHTVSTSRAQSDGLWCSLAAFAFAKMAGFDQTACWEVGVSVAELVANTLRQAGGGLLVLRTLETPRLGLEVIVSDRGPRATDIASGLPHAQRWRLPGPASEAPQSPTSTFETVRRLMNEVEVQVSPIEGMTVTARKWAPRPEQA